MGIEPLRFFNIVPCKYNDIPPSRGMGAPLLESEAVHAEGYLLGREGALHRAADEFDDARGGEELAHEKRIQHYINEQVYLSRKKDHDNPFRSCTSRNAEEELIVYGEVDANSFVRQVRTETSENIHKIEQLEELI